MRGKAIVPYAVNYIHSNLSLEANNALAGESFLGFTKE